MATDAANCWRGQCQSIFADVETAVSETLLVMAGVPDRGAAVPLQLLIGQRYDALAALTAADGSFAAEGGRVATALAKFTTHDSLRPFLCHAPGKVLLDRQGQWVLLLELLALRASRPERSLRAVSQAEADAIATTLARDGRSLKDRLAVMRAKLAPAA